MKKIILLGLMLVLGINTGFSQSILGNVTMSATPPEGYTLPKKDSAKVKINAASQSQKTGRLYDDFTYSGYIASVGDGDHVKKGETYRIKFRFDPRQVFDLRVVKGYSKNPIASSKDLRRGEWIAEIIPEKSTEIVVAIEGPTKGLFAHDRKFVLVIDPDKYDEIHAKFEEFRKNNDAKGRQKYVEELGGEEYQRYLKQLKNGVF